MLAFLGGLCDDSLEHWLLTVHCCMMDRFGMCGRAVDSMAMCTSHCFLFLCFGEVFKNVILSDNWLLHDAAHIH